MKEEEKDGVAKKKEAQGRGTVLVRLFLSALYLSAFTFGGGYVIVTLMKKKFVDEYHWIGEEEMLDLVAIAQSAPGAIAVNGAIVVGYKLAGIAGVIVSVTATVLPPFLIISVISLFYAAFRDNLWIALMLEGMQAGVGAVIASVSFDMGMGIVRQRDPVRIVIMAAAFAANYCLGISVVYIILFCGALGLAQQLWKGRSREG
ncbi:MAG: chromate transporter [Eubacteriales bacterium]|nr:chromate transporter [Eubacteriales bacterium]